ncbi:lipopolysaccharide assembly protein LapB [Carboxylicivirga sp. M1479]|uniref:tetratricopeptide repeat protein n=1 Tax=Carboxylicivirga sp. M1479 TaxID=2594476 RepID=UPI001178B867|nr:hypothetical protein [Carboxylicivirga sp. M1479]TRX72683.1 hypothetical protein FNN09_01725 [Carboxylicivirga sp. M1479]
MKTSFYLTFLLLLITLSSNAQNQYQLLLAEGRYSALIEQLSAQESTLSPSNNYYLAIAYQQNGYPQKAINCLLKDSTNLSTQQLDLLSRSYLSCGRYNDALPICVQRYKEEPQNIANLLRYAEINSVYKNFDANIKLLETYTEHDSTNLSINTLLAETYEKEKLFDAAMDSYKKILEQHRDNQKIAQRLANIYYRQKMYVECHELCMIYIEKLELNKNFLLLASCGFGKLQERFEPQCKSDVPALRSTRR